MKPRNIVSGLILFSIIIIAAMYSLDKMSAFHAKDNITPLGFPIKIFREEYTCYGSNCHQIVTILLQREDYSYVNIVKLSNWYIEVKRKSVNDSFNLHFSTRSEEVLAEYMPQDEYPWLTVKMKRAFQSPYDAFLFLSTYEARSDGNEAGYLSYRPFTFIRPYYRTVSIYNPTTFLSSTQ